MMSGFKTIAPNVITEDWDAENIIPPSALDRPSLEDLLAQVTPENLPEEVDTCWGKPKGSEEW